MQLDKSLSMLLFASATLSVACTTEAESFQHSLDANDTHTMRVAIEQGDLVLRGPASQGPILDAEALTVLGSSWGMATDPETAAERRDGNSWTVDSSARGELLIEARSSYHQAGVDFEVASPRELRSDMVLGGGTLTLAGTRGNHRVEAASLILDQAGGQLELYATSGGVHGSLLPVDGDRVTIYAEHGSVDLTLPRGLEYDLVVWASTEGTVMVDDLGLHARVEAQPGYFAGRSGRGRIEVEIIAPAGDVTIRESWIW
jgi:hypothetical protein